MKRGSGNDATEDERGPSALALPVVTDQRQHGQEAKGEPKTHQDHNGHPDAERLRGRTRERERERERKCICTLSRVSGGKKSVSGCNPPLNNNCQSTLQEA